MHAYIITLQYIYITHYITLPYLTLPYLTLPYLTLPYLTVHYITYITYKHDISPSRSRCWPTCQLFGSGGFLSVALDPSP